jgi:hypothetical protein
MFSQDLLQRGELLQSVKVQMSTSHPSEFYRITFDLPTAQDRVTYIRAHDEEHARAKLLDRFCDEGT